MAPSDETTKAGPANPQDTPDLDAPTPPGGPLRTDAPTAPVTPGPSGSAGSDDPERRSLSDEQEVEAPEESSNAGHASVGPEPEDRPVAGRDAPGPDPFDNAASSAGEPSDASGNE